MSDKPSPLTVITRPHPFTRVVIMVWNGNEENPEHVGELRWRPGAWTQVWLAPDDAAQAAHAMGKCRFTLWGSHKPGPYPTRVFFTQTFIDPDGHEMKTSGLRIKTKAAFMRQLKGLPFDYEVNPDAEIPQ